MASLLERYEREISRMERKYWLTYQWEELVLDPARKLILQQTTLSIPRFKNDEGTNVGRNIKYRDGRFKVWTGFRERLKPFHIYKNKIMIYWVPNMRTKTKGKWEIGVYLKPNFSTKKRARIDRALELGLMSQNQWNSFSTVSSYGNAGLGIGASNTLGWPEGGDNSKIIEGGSVRTEVGSAAFQRTQWNDDGELQNLKSAKTFVENIWKMAAINESYLRWMDDDTISLEGKSTPLIGGDVAPFGPEGQQDSSSWWDYAPFTKLSDWFDIITRPSTAYIINWTNFAPDV